LQDLIKRAPVPYGVDDVRRELLSVSMANIIAGHTM
jgi:hypothetical protein